MLSEHINHSKGNNFWEANCFYYLHTLLALHITQLLVQPSASSPFCPWEHFLQCRTGLHKEKTRKWARYELRAHNQSHNYISFVVCPFLKQSFACLSHGVDVRVNNIAGKPNLHIGFHNFLCLTGGVDIRVKHTTVMPTLHNMFHKGNINHTPHNITIGCICTPNRPLVIRTVSNDDHFGFDSGCMEGSFAF